MTEVGGARVGLGGPSRFAQGAEAAAQDGGKRGRARRAGPDASRRSRHWVAVGRRAWAPRHIGHFRAARPPSPFDRLRVATVRPPGRYSYDAATLLPLRLRSGQAPRSLAIQALSACRADLPPQLDTLVRRYKALSRTRASGEEKGAPAEICPRRGWPRRRRDSVYCCGGQRARSVATESASAGSLSLRRRRIRGELSAKPAS